MAEGQGTPTPEIKVLAPEQSVSELMQLDDDKWSEAMGLPTKQPTGEKAGEPTPAPAAKTATPEVKAPPTPPAKTPEAPPGTAEDGGEDDGEAGEDGEEKVEKPTYDFQIFDSEGELEVPDDFKITYKANGKVRKDVPLAKVVQLAKMGHYNHEREQELDQREKQAQAVHSQSQQVEQTLAQLKEQVTRMLEDEIYWQTARERWQQYNTPEAKARRLQDEVVQTREQLQYEREAVAVASAIQSYFVPAVDKILQGNPLVTEYEVLGRFNELVGPYLVNGRLPAARLQSVFDLIDTKLSGWATSIQEDRSERESVRRKETDAAKREAAAAKRRVARAVAPQGGQGGERAVKTDFATTKDWMDTMFPVKE